MVLREFPKILPSQEQKYIREEAKVQFTANKHLRDPEEIARKARYGFLDFC